MPIVEIDLTNSPGHLVQRCAACGAVHLISFDRAGFETGPEPFAIAGGGTLDIAIDGSAPTTANIAASAFTDMNHVSAVELATLLDGAPGLRATEHHGRVLVESAQTGSNSRLEVVGGTARKPLGLHVDGLADPCPGRPQLGVVLDQLQSSDAICLRRCSCGAAEVLVRTHDVAPADGTGFLFYEHRRAVNALAELFKEQGWVEPTLAPAFASESGPPPDVASLETGKSHALPIEL